MMFSDSSQRARLAGQIRCALCHGSSKLDTPSILGTWLREGVVEGNRNLILKLNRLRKENEQLYRLLGRATAEMQKSKS